MRGGFDGLLGRAGPWARAAGTAIQATRLMFGIDLNANKLLQFARRLGIAQELFPGLRTPVVTRRRHGDGRVTVRIPNAHPGMTAPKGAPPLLKELLAVT